MEVRREGRVERGDAAREGGAPERQGGAFSPGQSALWRSVKQPGNAASPGTRSAGPRPASAL